MPNVSHRHHSQKRQRPHSSSVIGRVVGFPGPHEVEVRDFNGETYRVPGSRTAHPLNDDVEVLFCAEGRSIGLKKVASSVAVLREDRRGFPEEFEDRWVQHLWADPAARDRGTLLKGNGMWVVKNLWGKPFPVAPGELHCPEQQGSVVSFCLRKSAHGTIEVYDVRPSYEQRLRGRIFSVCPRSSTVSIAHDHWGRYSCSFDQVRVSTPTGEYPLSDFPALTDELVNAPCEFDSVSHVTAQRHASAVLVTHTGRPLPPPVPEDKAQVAAERAALDAKFDELCVPPEEREPLQKMWAHSRARDSRVLRNMEGFLPHNHGKEHGDDDDDDRRGSSGTGGEDGSRSASGSGSGQHPSGGPKA